MSLRDKGVDVALWILCIDCGAAILWNSLGEVPAAFSLPYGDKGLHLASYFLLTFLLLLAAVWRPGRGPGPGDISKVLGSVAIFGILIEFAQGLWFERTTDASDALMNLIGIALAWGVWGVLRRMATT